MRKKQISLFNNRIVLQGISLIAWLSLFILSLKFVLSGAIPFWYDPARDLLLALDNFHKISLIGPPSGIPGIFYPPQWIWMLDIGLMFSHNPRIVDLIVFTLPYFLISPVIFYQFKNIFKPSSLAIVWFLFMINFNGYTTTIWSPNLAPFFLLIIMYLAVVSTIADPLRFFLLGLACATLVSVHISFGLGVSIGVFFYLIAHKIILLRFAKFFSIFSSLLLYLSGLFIFFIPTLIFEYRHGFNQIHSLFSTLSSSHAVVKNVGLSKGQVLLHMLAMPAATLHIPLVLSYVLIIATLAILFFRQKNKKTLTKVQGKLLLFLTTIIVSITILYLLTKNPVWSYHFIGVELIFLLFLGLIIEHIHIFKLILSLWIVWLFITFAHSTIRHNPLSFSTLATHEKVVGEVAADAKKSPYSVFAYNEAIYTYDYQYVFKWLENKDIPLDPNAAAVHTPLVYSIFPAYYSSRAIEGILHNQKGLRDFRIARRWQVADKTTIIKSVKP